MPTFVRSLFRGTVGFLITGALIGCAVGGATLFVNGTVTGTRDAFVLVGWNALAFALAFVVPGALAGACAGGGRSQPVRTPGYVAIASAAYLAFVGVQSLVVVIWPWHGDDAATNLALAGAGTLVVLVTGALAASRWPKPAATWGRRASVGLVLLGLLGALAPLVATRTEEPAPAPERALETTDSRVFLLALDGADGRLLQRHFDAGRLPHLAALCAGGRYGALETLLPCWSPILWTTVATGEPEERHGIRSFTEVVLPGMENGIQRTMGPWRLLPSNVGVAPLWRAFEEPWMPRFIRPISVLHRRSKPLWTILSEQDVDVGVIGWFPSWPAEVVDGFLISDNDPYRNLADFVNTGRSYVAAHGLTYPPELVDELATLPDNPWANPLSDWTLAEAGALPLFGDVFTSGREDVERWDRPLRIMLARHMADRFSTSAATHLIDRHAPRFMAVYLESLDRAGHLFGEPHPEVVDRTYEFIDELVGRLVAAAPDDTNWIVVSDHGWTDETGRLAAHDHGPPGVVILNGPAFRSAAGELERPTLFDVAPTVLGVFGLPAARSMPGRALVEAFTTEAARRVPREPIAGYGPHRPRWAVTEWEAAVDERGAQDVQEQLRELGYVE